MQALVPRSLKDGVPAKLVGLAQKTRTKSKTKPTQTDEVPDKTFYVATEPPTCESSNQPNTHEFAISNINYPLKVICVGQLQLFTL